MATLAIENGKLGYKHHLVAEAISASFVKPEIVSIIGPNGSGKSTLLKALGRLLTPLKGTVLLNGSDIAKLPSQITAQRISLLPQSSQAPDDMTIMDLVSCGRMPYQSAFSELNKTDYTAIDNSLKTCGLEKMRYRRLGALSGGERQRAWLAMALAQEPEILLLDEPTTYLDIHYQLELMEMVRKLYDTLHITVIMVMHDLNHAAAYSHRLIAVKNGTIVADDTVANVFTCDILEPLYNVKMSIIEVGSGSQKSLACSPYKTESR